MKYQAVSTVKQTRQRLTNRQGARPFSEKPQIGPGTKFQG